MQLITITRNININKALITLNVLIKRILYIKFNSLGF